MAELDECRICGAMVDRMSRHKRWHQDLDKKLKAMQGEIDDLEDRVSELES